MNLENNLVQSLAAVYRPAFENATTKSTLNELGMIKVKNEMANTEWTYRRANNVGGALKFRANGENISVSAGGVNYTDEKVLPCGFADSRSIPVGQIGLRNPESLDPTSRDTLARVATSQMDELMTEAANTMRLWASLSVLPSVSIGGVTFTNSKVDTSISYTGVSDTWATVSNDIVGQILNLQANFYGTGIPASGLTVLHSSKQKFNLMRNESVIKLVGFDQSQFGVLASAVGYTKLQETLVQLSNITFVEWNDTYYANNNEGNPYNVTKFLPDNYIVVIPTAYYQKVVGSLVFEQITARSTNAPFIELITAPSADFAYKTKRTRPGSFGGVGVIPGAYVYTGIYEGSDPAQPDCYKSGVAMDIGLFVERSLNIKYIQVQS